MPQKVSGQTKPQKKNTNKKRSKFLESLIILGLVFLSLVLILVILIAVKVLESKIQTNREHSKLLNEIKVLNFSSYQPQILGFGNEPTDSEQLFSDSYSGVYFVLPLPKTTLGAETNAIKSALQKNNFTIDDQSSSYDDIIASNKNFFFNIGIENNGSPLDLVKTGKFSSFNGEPIVADPGPSTPVNDLRINLEDTSTLIQAF